MTGNYETYTLLHINTNKNLKKKKKKNFHCITFFIKEKKN